MNSISVVVVTPAFDRTLPTANQETLWQIGLVSPEISVSDASLAGMTSVSIFNNRRY